MSKFISIVIPTYNRREDLKNCLISIDAQNYPKELFEVIVVDDGSNDGTKEMVKEFLKNHKMNLNFYKLDYNSGNAGLVRNLGIEKSNGEIIAFTDSDCILDENWLKDTSIAFNGDIGGVYGKVELYDISKSISLRILAGIYFRKKWKKNTMNNVALKKRIAQKIKFNENLKTGYGEDIDFIQRCELLMKKKGLKFKEINSLVYHNIHVSLFYLAKVGYRFGYGYSHYLKSQENNEHVHSIPLFLTRHIGIFLFPLATIFAFFLFENLIPEFLFLITFIFYLGVSYRSCEPFFPYLILSPLFLLHSGGILAGIIVRKVQEFR